MDMEMESFYVAARDDMSVSAGDDRSIRSDDASITSDRSSSTTQRRHPERRPHRSRRLDGQMPASSINYHGINIIQAAGQGNLPLCVLLWGMATAKRVNLMEPDAQGNTPMHFAALADLPEVMGFLQQQGRSRHNNDNRLVDSRNEMGEIPLLRAASVGKIPVLKFLLDEGSDPFCTDRLGNTIFITLARFSHIWGLHYVYSSLCDKFGHACIYELLSATDVEGNNALDWAADAGDVNVIEYLIRKSLDPTRVNGSGSSALHLAVRSGKVDAVRFLVKCGCDPYQLNGEKESPMMIAALLKSRDLIAAMNNVSKTVHRRRRRGSLCGSRRDDASDCVKSTNGLVGIPGGSGDIQQDIETAHRTARLNSLLGSTQINSDGNEIDHVGMVPLNMLPSDHRVGISLYSETRQGDKRPHALCRLKPSRFEYAFMYAVIIVGYWILTTCIPFYAWLVLVLLSFLLFRYVLAYVQTDVANKAMKQPHRCQRHSYFQEFILAPEKFLGVYMGMVITCLLFWLCSLRVGVISGFLSSGDPTGDGALYLESLRSGTLTPSTDNNFLDIGGLSGSTDDFPLFFAAMSGLVLGTFLWGQLVWFDSDPGAVYTRDTDFDMILDQCLNTLSAASGQLYCRTTLVKKPIRSKYCQQTGLVVARMDHFCVWLNNSVGYGNHRLFMIFLFCQFGATSVFATMLIRALHREMGFRPSACGAVSHLLDRLYFFPLALCVVLIIISLILVALLIEQSINISKNITTNERLNRSRYPWMNDSLGQPFNHFDRGFMNNFLEFWSFPGFERDYYSEFNWLSLRDNMMSSGEEMAVAKREAERADMMRSRPPGEAVPNPRRSDGTSTPPLQPPVATQVTPTQPFQLSVDQRQVASIPRFKLLAAKASGSSNSTPTQNPPLQTQSDLTQSQMTNMSPGNYSVLTRAQEAQMQFEARVQQAIDMSNLPRDANAVRSSRGMAQSDQHAQNSGYTPYIESDRRQTGGITDWHVYDKSSQNSSQRNDLTADSSANEIQHVAGSGYVDSTSSCILSHPLSATEGGLPLHQLPPPVKRLDQIPTPQHFSKSFPSDGSTGGEVRLETRGPWTTTDMPFPRQGKTFEPGERGMFSELHGMERACSAPSSPSRHFPIRLHRRFNAEGSPNPPLQPLSEPSEAFQPLSADRLLEEKVQRSIDHSKMDDDEMESNGTEQSISDHSHYSNVNRR